MVTCYHIIAVAVAFCILDQIRLVTAGGLLFPPLSSPLPRNLSDFRTTRPRRHILGTVMKHVSLLLDLNQEAVQEANC